MAQHCRSELMDALSKRYQDALHSDLQIVCGDTTYQVHKVIVCSLSPFFAEACRGFLRQSFFGADWCSAVKIPDDDPTAVRLMVHYFYHLDYPYIPLSGGVHDLDAMAILPFGVIRSAADEVWAMPSPEKKKKKTKKKKAKELAWTAETELEIPAVGLVEEPPLEAETEKVPEAEVAEAEPVPEIVAEAELAAEPEAVPEVVEEPVAEPWPESEPMLVSQASESESKPEPPALFDSRETNLILHVRVYALAGKYAIEGLKEVALLKFKAELDTNWATRDFLDATKIVYDSIPKSDRGMRDAVVEAFHKYGLLTQPGLKEYIRDIVDLVYDLLVYAYAG